MLTYEVVQDNGDVWEIDAEHVIVANGEVSFIDDDGDMVTVLDVEAFSVVDDEEYDDEEYDEDEYEEAVDIYDVEYSEEDGEFVVWSEEDDCYYIVEYDSDVDAYFYVSE